MLKKIFISAIIIMLPAFSFGMVVNGDLLVKGNSYVTTLSEGSSKNCGLSISGTTFTINQANGNAFSASNPCKIGIRSNASGRIAEAIFTSNVSFTFGAASDTDGNDWGVTNTANWSNVMPFFLGVIYDGTTPYFTISRGPIVQSGAASTDLCQKGSTDCDAQSDVMILATGLTLANFVNLPITQVGWFQMTYATAGGAWTTSLSTKTGFNKLYQGIKFDMPTGQMGATSGKYFKDQASIAPVFATNSYFYSLDENGFIDVSVNLFGDGGTDGSGADGLKMPLPYSIDQNVHVLQNGYFASENFNSLGIGGGMVRCENITLTPASSSDLNFYYGVGNFPIMHSEIPNDVFGIRRLIVLIRAKVF